MDHFTELPDHLLIRVNQFLLGREIANNALVCKAFYRISLFSLYQLYIYQGWGKLSMSDSLLAYGSIYTKKLKLVSNWESVEEIHFIDFNNLSSVQEIGFGSGFISVLRHDSSVISSIITNDGSMENIKLPGTSYVACNLNTMVLIRFGKPEFYRALAGELNKTVFPVEDISPSCIAAGVHGYVGTDDGHVYVWNEDTFIDIQFPEPIICPIRSLKCTTKILLVLTNAQQLFKVNLSDFTVERMLPGKAVSLIGAGYTHFLALVQEEFPPLTEWSPSFLADWMIKVGFEDCYQLIINNQVAGEELATADREYLSSTLGILEYNRQLKLELELNRVREKSTSKVCELYGWGVNYYCQLGNDQNKYQHPTRLKLPELFPEEMITSVHCDKKRSFLFTSFGRFFALGGGNFKKLTKEEKKESPGFKDYTKNLTGNGKIELVKICPGHEDQIGFIYRNKNGDGGDQKVKMKVGSAVLNDIIFSTRFDSEDFVVGYNDRFLGILEMPATEFNNTEIPKHRIRYFKKNGQIVWDRRTRVDLM